MLNDKQLAEYWDDIPTNKQSAITYAELCALWKCTARKARAILHELSRFDNGDNFILIRSSSGKGFYKTDNEIEIAAYKRECLKKGRNVFAPVKKINRVLNANSEQFALDNNLRVVRESRGMKQSTVCAVMQKHDRAFDASLLSKMENGICLPTAAQLQKLSEIYGVSPFELLDNNLYC